MPVPNQGRFETLPDVCHHQVWESMRHITLGIVIITVLFMTGFVAGENNTTSAQATNGSEWIISPEASLALVQVQGADLGMIEDVYGYLLTGNMSEKDEFKEVAEDPNGTIDALLTTIQSSTNKSPDASADIKELYDVWDTLNASAFQVISSYEANNSVPVSSDVITFEKAAVNFTRVNDKLISRYVNKNAINKDFFTIVLYIDLLGSINAQEAYVLTANPEEKGNYDQKMKTFDADAELFTSRFPDSSIENLKAMKKNLDDIVQVTSFDTTGTVSQENILKLTQAITDIMTGYSQISSF